jgi:predicted DNA-binding transcriptional regulator AlpA
MKTVGVTTESVAVSVRTAARMLGCSTKTVLRLRLEGKFPGAFRLKRAWRIPEPDLVQFRTGAKNRPIACGLVET